MSCPFCNDTRSKVIDSRDSSDGVRRRRECLACSRRFTTYEKVHIATLMVVKSDGRRQPFDEGKLEKSVNIACGKRRVSTDKMTDAVGNIGSKIYQLGDREIQSRAIGELVMNELRGLDNVAYIRYASVYREFDDAGSFTREVENLRNDNGMPSAAQMPLIDMKKPVPTNKK